MMRVILKSGLILLLALLSTLALAQEATGIVPDLRGLNIPQAAALLNQHGLRLGTQSAIGWTAESGLPQNSIDGQSLSAGSQAEAGSAVDVTILRSPNVNLIYDDNDLTLLNRLAEPVAIAGLTFTSVEGSSASFAARRWSDNLREGQCLQIWSVNRNGPKDLEDCRLIQGWLTTTNTAEHFWTQASGAQRFSVIENGIERASCPAAPPNSQAAPLSCEFFLAGGGAASEVTPFVYFAYTPEVIALINPTEDRWMLTESVRLYNYNPSIAVPGATLNIGQPDIYGSPDIVADIRRLAPGQCLMLTSDNASAQPPEDCTVIARLDTVSSVAFWLAAFEIEGANANQRYTCPAAVDGRMTICIMPQR